MGCKTIYSTCNRRLEKISLYPGDFLSSSVQNKFERPKKGLCDRKFECRGGRCVLGLTPSIR